MFMDNQEVEELISKLNLRLGYLNDLKYNFNQKNSNEKQNKIVDEFTEFEDELRQAIQTIKSLIVQNKDFYEQIQEKDKNYNELKDYSEKSPHVIQNSYLNSNSLTNYKDYNNEICEKGTEVNGLVNQLSKKNREIENYENFAKELEKNNELLFIENKQLKEQLISKSINQNNREETTKATESNIKLTKSNFLPPNESKLKEDLNKNNKVEVEKFNSKIGSPLSKSKNLNEVNERMLSEKELFNQMVNEYLNTHNEYPTEDNIENENSKIKDISGNKSWIENMSNTQSLYENKKKESMIDKITGLILEVNKSKDLLNYCNNKLGDNFQDLLLSPETTNKYFVLVNQCVEDYLRIKNYEEGKFPQEKESKNFAKKQEYQNQIEYQANNIQDPNLFQYSNIDDLVKTTSDNTFKQKFYQQNKPPISNSYNHSKSNSKQIATSPSQTSGGGFEKNLRKYSSTSNYSNNQSVKEKKIFNNYTRPYGRFFDQKYQYGGDSKIDNRGRKKKNEINYQSNYQQDNDFEGVSKMSEIRNQTDLKLKQLSLSRENEYYYNDRDDNLTFKSSERKNESHYH